MSDETEYKNLLSYFKSVVGYTALFVGFITSIGALVFAADRSDLQSRLAQLEIDYGESIERIEAKADVTVASVQEKVAVSISREIQNEVVAQLGNRNVQAVIDKQLDSYLKRSMSFELRSKIEESIEESRDEFNELADIHDAATWMRVGNKTGLQRLKKFIQTAKYTSNRARANEMFNRIEMDYQDTFERLYTQQLQVEIATATEGLSGLEACVKAINELEGLDIIAMTVEMIYRDYDIRFRPFDFDRILDWIETNSE